MTVADLATGELRQRLRGPGLRLRVGPFLASITSSMPAVELSVSTLYAAHQVADDGSGAHFTLRVDRPRGLRGFVRPQVRLTFDGQEPFLPLPSEMAAPLLEAGLNWSIGNFAHHYLVIHAATLQRDGRALLLPAPPGSGKSTLCAALTCRGWRLLSDEFALVDPSTGLLHPVPRPVALKGRSIALIRAWSPEVWLGPEVDNHEGERVSYMRPPAESVRDSSSLAVPAWVVIPKFDAGSPTIVEAVSKARALAHLADNSFNYNLHGRSGFERLAAIAEATRCVSLRYSDLEAGVRTIQDDVAAAVRPQ